MGALCSSRQLSRNPPSLPLPIGLTLALAEPPHSFEGGSNAALVSRSNSRGLDVQRFARHLADRDPGLSIHVVLDAFFLDIGLVPGCLLRHDVLALKLFIWPPWLAGSVPEGRLSEELISVLLERFNLHCARAPERIG